MLSKRIEELSVGWEETLHQEAIEDSQTTPLLDYQLDERPLQQAIDNLTFLQFQGKRAAQITFHKPSV